MKSQDNIEEFYEKLRLHVEHIASVTLKALTKLATIIPKAKEVVRAIQDWSADS